RLATPGRRPRQPGFVQPSGGICDHAGAHPAWADRRFQGPRRDALRLRATLYRRGRRHGRCHNHRRRDARAPLGQSRTSQAGLRHMTASYDPSKEGAEMSFREKMSYGDYLHLERILTAQEPLSQAHDELLFIVQHQTSELWMKLAIHEIRSAMS